ncbi:GlxA family transcriptional regulator [Luteimonas salinilitoris]|uniref:GlxA family transcriptional regulator n=1 Tax=Luteimonas salinilitoris TaxID=3237697 RepID=A0ABV4HRC6_9GAMM
MTDLLQSASGFAVARGAQPLRVSHWKFNENKQMVRVYDTHPGADRSPDILVAPALIPVHPTTPVSLGPLERARELQPFADWLAERHVEGATIASTGCGAFVLASAGLLAGRAATTHWLMAEKFQANFPNVKLDVSRAVIEDGDILTAGGMMAWTDLGMRLIDRLLGPTIVVETAQFWLIDPAAREQRHYSTFSPRLSHGDAAILKVQHKLQVSPTRPVSVADMARMAKMEARTFLRRFKAATGLKPIEYVQQLRIGKAREVLQFTRRPVEQVAWEVGYDDAAAFRRLFLRLVGLTPSEYRRRFTAADAGAAKS